MIKGDVHNAVAPLVCQYAGRERRSAVEPAGQQAERTLAGLRDDPRDAGLVRKDLGRQQDLKVMGAGFMPPR